MCSSDLFLLASRAFFGAAVPPLKPEKLVAAHAAWDREVKKKKPAHLIFFISLDCSFFIHTAWDREVPASVSLFACSLT